MIESNWTRAKSKEILDKLVDQILTEDGAYMLVDKICMFQDMDDRPSSHWSVLNRLIQCINDPDEDCRTVKQWNYAGRSVIPGSKCIYIFQPITGKTKTDDETDEQIILKGYRLLPVFPYSCTVGKPVPMHEAKKNLDVSKLPLKEIADELGCNVSAGILDKGVAGAYNLGFNSITLSSENLSVWLHELSHKIDAELGNITLDNCQENYAFNECVAEHSSLYLCKLMGIQDCSIARTRNYINAWSGKVHVGFKMSECISRVQKIFEYICKLKTKGTKEVPSMKKKNKETKTVGINFQTKDFEGSVQMVNPRNGLYIKKSLETGRILDAKRTPFRRVSFTNGMVASALPPDGLPPAA